MTAVPCTQMANQVSAETRQLRPAPDEGEAKIAAKENSNTGFALKRSLQIETLT